MKDAPAWQYLGYHSAGITINANTALRTIEFVISSALLHQYEVEHLENGRSLVISQDGMWKIFGIGDTFCSSQIDLKQNLTKLLQRHLNNKNLINFLVEHGFILAKWACVANLNSGYTITLKENNEVIIR